MGFDLRNYRDQYIDGLQQTLTVLFCVHQMNVDDGPERKRNRRDTSGENKGTAALTEKK
jgi:hypothetical protein